MALKRPTTLTIFVGMFAAGTAATFAACGSDETSQPLPIHHPEQDGGGGEATTDAPSDAPPDAPADDPILRTEGIGSAVAISDDDTTLVAANRDDASVSVFSITYAEMGPPTVTRIAKLDVGGEPWQVAIHPDGDHAYVVLRQDQKLVEITGLKSKPAKGKEAGVGSEPTGVALSPLGKTAWVANWVEGTVSGVDTATMTVASTINLNDALAKSGMLGAGVAARPALAHPRSVAVSNNRDKIEDDETLYATEYFAQQKTALAPDGSNADTTKVGIVYKIPLSSKTVSNLIELPPIDNVGFNDHESAPTGCYPNQLQSMKVNGAFGYVVSVCASPRGPLGMFTGPAAPACPNGDADCPGAAAGSCVAGTCTTNCTMDMQCGANGGKCNANVCAPNPANVFAGRHPAVTVLDLGGNKAFGTVSLAKEFFNLYEGAATLDTSDRRYPQLANDLSFVPDTVTAYFSAGGANAVFRVQFDATYDTGIIDNVGTPVAGKHFIDLAPAMLDPAKAGMNPMGLVVARGTHPADTSPRYAFVANEGSRNVTVIDVTKNEIAGISDAPTNPQVVESAPMPTDALQLKIADGKRHFNTGIARWSNKGQGWGSCSECHIDGLSDNVTWYFARGPRQSTSVDGSFGKTNPADQRLFGWNASFDEPSNLDVGVFRNQLNGVGAIVKDASLNNANRIDLKAHGGLNGSTSLVADPQNPTGLPEPCVLSDWGDITEYLRTVRTPRRPVGLDAMKVAAGKTLFESANCAGCHGGPLWSISTRFYVPQANNSHSATQKATSWDSAATSSGFPMSLLPVATAANRVMRYNGTNGAAFDSMWCALRPVGTFGVAEADVGTAELRQNMTATAQGNEADGNGYSPPSLLGLSVGAPYFHAGGARTLEAALSQLFKTHHQALSAGFLDAADPDLAEKTSALVEYLLSIDSSETPIAVPALGKTGGVLCSAP